MKNMHINELGYDILYEIFSWVYSYCGSPIERHKRIHDLDSVVCVCRFWRDMALPLKYQTICMNYSGDTLTSNALVASACGYAKYAKVLELNIFDLPIEEADLVGKMEEAGIAKAIWPQTSKLVISCDNLQPQLAHDNSEFKGTISTIEALLKFLDNHVPNIEDIEFADRFIGEYDFEKDYKYLYSLISGLFNAYATAIKRASLYIPIRDGIGELSFPKQITHLEIDMACYERWMLAKIFAPSLQSLRLELAPPEITWSWFDSGDDRDVWFTSLKKLSIEFDYSHDRQSYHNSDLSAVDTTKFKSDYKESAKHAHFPALAYLEIQGYPFKDDSFYRLFEGCPLKKLHLVPPLAVQYHIPPCLLAKVEAIHARPHFESSLYNAGDQSQMINSDEEVLEKCFANLLSVPSSAHSVILEAGYSSPGISFPDKVAWNDVRSLDVSARINMASIFTILAQMPRLRHLRVQLPISHLNSAYHGHCNGLQPTRQRQHRTNRALEFMEIAFWGVEFLEQDSLRVCLSTLLPLVPGLLKLVVSPMYSGIAKAIADDLKHSTQSISRQLEVV